MFRCREGVRYGVYCNGRPLLSRCEDPQEAVLDKVRGQVEALLQGGEIRIEGDDDSLFCIEGEWVRLPSLMLTSAQVNYFSGAEEDGPDKPTLGSEIVFLEKVRARDWLDFVDCVTKSCDDRDVVHDLETAEEFLESLRNLAEMYGRETKIEVLLEAHFRESTQASLMQAFEEAFKDPKVQKAMHEYLQAYIREGEQIHAEVRRLLGLDKKEEKDG